MAKEQKQWYSLSNNMTPEEKQQQKDEIVSIVMPSIETGIDKYVNGKIDRVHTKLDEEKEARIAGDKTINEKLDSIVSVADWFRKLGKGVVYAGILAAAITAVIVLYKTVT